jgi:branched-chain amino acid transport system substrate-binding protein
MNFAQCRTHIGFRRTLAAVAAACVLSAALPEPARSAEPFEIPVMISQTGAAAFLGNEQRQSYTILQGFVNKSGGIRGRPLKFVFYNDQSSPQVGLQIVNELVAKGTTAFLGSSFAQVCAAVMPLVNKNGPVEYCLSPGVHPVAGSFVFASSVSTRDIVSVMFRFLRERGWKNVAFITSTDQTGQDFERAFDASLALRENAAFSAVAREHFAPNDIGVSAQMVRIKAAAPQAVFAWSVGSPFGTLLHGLNEAGLDVPVLSSNGNMVFAQLAQYASFMPAQMYFPGTTALVPGTIGPGPIRAKQARFYKAFAAAGDPRPDNPNNTAWDPAMILIDAYRHLGTDASAAAIRDFIHGQHGWTGINGVYDYSDPEQRGLGASALVMYRYDAKTTLFTAVTRPGGGKR